MTTRFDVLVRRRVSVGDGGLAAHPSIHPFISRERGTRAVKGRATDDE